MQAAERLEPGQARIEERRLELEQPEPLDPRELRQIVREASRALAFLNVVRLEELAFACQKLTRDLVAQPAAIALAARQASPDMAVFARVLDATRANLDVMSRLRDVREGRLEYTLPQAVKPESVHGHD
jgi:hypothetical protein